jgi:hypothetical protein
MRGSWSPAPDGRVPVLLDALLPQAHRDRPPELARHELAGHEGVAVANDATAKVVTAEALGGGDLHARGSQASPTTRSGSGRAVENDLGAGERGEVGTGV